MTQLQDVFERYEKKYLVNDMAYAALREGLKNRMCMDEYGRHTICNLYYDTGNFQMIRASLDRPVYKEKIRLRSYGVPGPESTVFLEMKKKYRGVVYKRRAPMPLRQAERFLSAKEFRKEDSQILREIAWSLDQYRPQAKVFIGYDRIALFSQEDPGLRVTFDTGIRYRDTNLRLSEGDWGEQLRQDGQILMEIKIPGAMPLWLSHLLDRLEIRPVSFSKYGYCYQNRLFPRPSAKGGILCA